MTSILDPGEIKDVETMVLIAEDSVKERGISSVGDYDLLSEIGQGGFGKVYKAKHKNIDKIVALKVVHASLIADATVIKRFEQEAIAASYLTHANLAAVYDHGRTNAGAPFLVMDYLKGDNLAQTIEKEGPIPCKRALEMMIELADGMDHAHKKGILHRDLKPSNIIVSTVNNLDSVKIIDFGIAKLLTVPRSNATRITQTAQVLGSPAYMSPEQCLGQTLDARSDIYSLGCIMYEIITGNAPLVGANPVQTVVKQIHDHAPAFTAQKSNRLLKRLQQVIFKSLSKDPDDRYQSMAELSADLRRVKSGHNPKWCGYQYVIRMSLGAFVGAAVVSVACLILNEQRNDPHYEKGGLLSGKKLSSHHFTNPAGTPAGIEIRSIDNRVLYKSNAHSLKAAVAEASSKKVNLKGANLANADLASIEIGKTEKEPTTGPHPQAEQLAQPVHGLQFEGMNFAGADFSDSDLENATFSHCNLTGAKFRGTQLYQSPSREGVRAVLFEDCKLQRATFVGCACQNEMFENSDLSGSVFDGMKLNGCQFRHCDFSSAKLVKSSIKGACFEGSHLDHTDFSYSSLSFSEFPRSDLTGVEFKGAVLTGVNFAHAQVKGDCMSASEWADRSGYHTCTVEE